MPNNRMIIKKYVFSVEGETEKWYLEWLQEKINLCDNLKCKTKIDAKVQKSPKKFSKTVNVISTSKVTHICDYESNEPEHVNNFRNILSELKDANLIRNSGFKYSLGYSNFTFELWIILHKKEFNGCVANRKHYLSQINKIFNERFESLNEYKHEINFKRCLAQLSIEDVKKAIFRSKAIMNNKVNNGEFPEQYMNFEYYKQNPALTIWESINEILTECGLL